MKKLLLALVFVLLCTGAAAPIWDTPTVSISWENTPVDQDIVKIEVILCIIEEDYDNPAYTFTVDDPMLLQPNTVSKMPIRTIVEPMAEGTYWLYARFVNVCEAKSDWSDGLLTVKRWVPPDPPSGGCQILR